MDADLGYDETLRVLRQSLVRAVSNAWVFTIRARGRPQLLSARGWLELVEIERTLGGQLERALRSDLRVEPWSALGRTRSLYRGIWDSLRGERALVVDLFGRASRDPVDAWRRGAPQLEESLWPFFTGRTHYLANTFALALDEPAPFPTVIWHPGRREFRT